MSENDLTNTINRLMVENMRMVKTNTELAIENMHLATEIARLAAENTRLLAACEAFLKAYQDAAREYHFGQMLDSAFCDVLEPVYDAVRKAKGER